MRVGTHIAHHEYVFNFQTLFSRQLIVDSDRQIINPSQIVYCWKLIISNIVYSADNSVITDVFCNGKQIMKNGKVNNEKQIIEDFKSCFNKLIQK